MMKIRTNHVGVGCWTAVDDETYDGAPDTAAPCSFIGTGLTRQEAVNDLREKWAEWRAEQRTPVTVHVCHLCSRKAWTRYWRVDRSGNMICDDCWGVHPSTNAKLRAAFLSQPKDAKL